MTRKNNKRKQNKNNYAKYSGLAFEMLGIIFLGVFVGVKLDEKLEYEKPVFTVILSLLSVFISLYLVLKDFIKK